MKHRRLRFAVIAILAFASREASAQFGGGGIGGSGPANGSSGPAAGRPDVEPSPEDTDGPIKQGRNSVKLFDSYRSTFSYQLDLGPIWTRRTSDTTPLSRRTNFEHRSDLASEIAISSIVTTPSARGPFYVTSSQFTVFRILDAKSFAWSLFSQKLGGGIVLGPFEFEAKFGIHGITADIMHAQPSIELLSPLVEAGVGLRLGKFRLDIKRTPNTCGAGSGRIILSGG